MWFSGYPRTLFTKSSTTQLFKLSPMLVEFIQLLNVLLLIADQIQIQIVRYAVKCFVNDLRNVITRNR